MKKLFIFDCFGVLISELAPIWFSRRYDERTAAKLKQQYFGGADRGERTIGELIDDIATGLNIDKAVIVAELKEIFSINGELFDFIAEIRKTHPRHDIALLSNAPQGLVEAIFEKYGMYGFFDRTFVSWQYKMAKPDIAFYELCVSEMHDEYDKILMIDDNAKNLEPLKGTKITPVLYKDNQHLFETLKAEL